MKININKKLKIGIISVLVILIGIISFLLYKEITVQAFEEQRNPVYTYSNKANINYKVYVKPNKLYDINPLDEGKLYITEFVDYINTTFNYEFTGEREVDLKGNYSIVAKVQGFTGEGEKLINIWEKDFPFITKKNFSGKDKSKSIKEEIRINLDEYNTFVKEIIEATKINCQTTLNLVMDIDLDGETDKGSINETISQNIKIPLNTTMFQISGNSNVEKSGVIEETNQISLPVNKKQVIVYAIILAIILIALILVTFFTKSTLVTKTPQEKMLKEIFRKHGDRLVALSNHNSIANTSTNMVKSIEDLVKIADEIEKPIMYKYSSSYEEIKRFYVSDGREIFVLEIDELLKDNKTYEKEKITVEEV